MKGEGAAVVPAGAELDDELLAPTLGNKFGAEVEEEAGLLPPKLGNKLEVGVEEEVELLPPKLGNKLGVGAGVDAGAVELGAALEAGVENIPPNEGVAEPVVAAGVVVEGFPKNPPDFGAWVLGVVLAPPNKLGVAGVDDPAAGFCPKGLLG